MDAAEAGGRLKALTDLRRSYSLNRMGGGGCAVVRRDLFRGGDCFGADGSRVRSPHLPEMNRRYYRLEASFFEPFWSDERLEDE